MMHCASCGKQAVQNEIFDLVAKKLPSGKHEEIHVCQKCRPSFRQIEHIFILHGVTYPNTGSFPFWRNDAPLSVQFDRTRYPLEEQLPLDDFPLIEDFEVVMVGFTLKHRQEDHLPTYYSAKFFSPSRGFLAHLLFDTPQDLCQPDFAIPSGTFSEPYDDLDQGWNMLVAEDQTFVYVITGNWEIGEGQRTWFKVEKDRYYRQWEKAIQFCRTLDLAEE